MTAKKVINKAVKSKSQYYKWLYMSVLSKAAARKLLNKFCIQSPTELQLEKIANAEHLIIEEAELNNFIGLINYSDNAGLIKIHSGIKERGQKRFIIAHELGHYYNDNKNGIGCTQLDLLNYKSQREAELDANDFAAELLMPAEWVKDFVRKNKPGVDLLKKGSDYFGVSLSALGIRIAETGDYPFAVIMSTAGKVVWSSINKFFPFNWIPNGYKVNNNSYAFDCFERQKIKIESKNDENIKIDFNVETSEAEEVLADAWFWDDNGYKKNYYMFEQNIDMPRYNSVLTILWGK